MRLVVPCVPAQLQPATLVAVRAAGYQPEVIDTSDDDEAYYRLLAQLWRSGDDFCLVEQDMVPTQGVLREIEACPEGWCGEVYYLPWQPGGFGTWHGVTRYRGAFTATHASVPDRIPDKRWQTLDSAWINRLREDGEPDAHRHWPAARHLNADHGDAAAPWAQGSAQVSNCRCGAALPTVDPATGDQTCPRCGQVYRFRAAPSMTAPV